MAGVPAPGRASGPGGTPGPAAPAPRGWFAAAAARVALRPWLWPTALRQVLRLAPMGWWRRWPPVPVPDPAYLRFRFQTQYGDPDHRPDPADVVSWLEWCRRTG